ncbi:hypothetical protein AUC60_12140, partial [Pseudomonas caspiana]
YARKKDRLLHNRRAGLSREGIICPDADLLADCAFCLPHLFTALDCHAKPCWILVFGPPGSNLKLTACRFYASSACVAIMRALLHGDL